MKLIASILTGLFISLIPLTAQNCKVYIPNQIGKEIVLTNYDKKDKVTGTTTQTIKDIKEKGDSTIFYVHALYADEKGKNPYETDMVFKCVDNVFYIDMEGYINQEQIEAYKDMDITVTTKEMGFPADIKEGQTLEDGWINLEILMGSLPMNFRVDVTNRKVVGEEAVTTPAGTYKCLKAEEDVTSKMGFANFTYHTIGWYSESIGTVRQETYKGDKLQSYTVLTSVK